MSDISREEFQKLASDIVQVKNDVNIIKANTQMNANLLSLLHSDDITAIVFSIANSERLCKALMICKKPTSAMELCRALQIKRQNIRKLVIDRLIEGSLLTVGETQGRRTFYVRVPFLDLINFDRLAVKKYPNIQFEGSTA